MGSGEWRPARAMGAASTGYRWRVGLMVNHRPRHPHLAEGSTKEVELQTEPYAQAAVRYGPSQSRAFPSVMLRALVM